ncbi:hypothetical protein [Marinomonas algicola]|uniref:hypothetical protein n=1 Tax=Marinomonas algicola TaxID=2773454 RepID=UPI00174C3521|nr:hypothetical protein [Marinomonas algicola]
MKNEQLIEIMQKRETAQDLLMNSLKNLQDVSPMSLISGGFKGLGSVAAQLESVAFLNDQVITELTSRALKDSQVINELVRDTLGYKEKLDNLEGIING